MMMMPFVSMPFELSALICSYGISDPTAATTEVGVNMLDETEAKVAAPPNILVSVRKGVRVVSNATVPKTVSNAYLVDNIISLLNACRHH
jgi:hypothetical protein